MKKLLYFIFSLFCLTTFGQTFPQLPTDFSRPGAGANEWSYDQNIVNIPVQGTNTQRLDRYWRFTWLDFQPANGTAGAYNFSLFDSKIQQSITKGQTFSFGVMQQCGGCDAPIQTNVGGSVMLYPTWLHAQMQSESVKDFTSGGEWFPNYNSPSYLIALKNLNIAINAHIISGSYMGVRYQDVIGQIDIRGYGDFGEWTNNVFTNGNLTVASGDSIISYHVHVFDKFQCVYMMATVDGGQLSNTNVPPAIGYYALTVSNSVGKLGWRRDSWGQTDNYLSQWTDANPTVYNGLVFKTEIMNRYQVAPIVGEPQDGGSAGNFTNLAAQMTKYGTTSFGNGNFNSGTNATIFNSFRAASAVAGYKLTLTAWSISGKNLSLSWTNLNTAPAYISWNVNLELRSGSSVLWVSKSKFNPKGLRGSVTVIDTLPSGTGDLYLIIRDPLNYRKPMPLAIAGQNADGSYLIKANVTIAGGTVTPPPPPPVDTVVVLPVNCDTTVKVSHKNPVYTSRQVIDTTYTTTVTDSIIHRVCTTLPPPPPVKTTLSIFTTQAPKVTAKENDGGSIGIETGVKFRSTVAGVVTAISFYKGTGTTGTHTGEIYTKAGARLASVVFTETASGVQTATFASPVAISANTTYIAAVFSSSGDYVGDLNYFSQSVTNGTLSALADGTDGINGLYIFTNTPALPTQSYLKTNYWIGATVTTN